MRRLLFLYWLLPAPSNTPLVSRVVLTRSGGLCVNLICWWIIVSSFYGALRLLSSVVSRLLNIVCYSNWDLCLFSQLCLVCISYICTWHQQRCCHFMCSCHCCIYCVYFCLTVSWRVLIFPMVALVRKQSTGLALLNLAHWALLTGLGATTQRKYTRCP